MLAAMLSTLKPETRVLVPRNIHRSVISGMILTGANPVWFLPDWLEPWGVWSGITAEQITEQLEAAEKRSERITAVIITSPTYEGIGSDIPAIAEVCRRHGAYLLVDEAHGSLWPFSNRLPVSACQSRCDFVVHSLHKTAGSLTQSSMAHLPHGSRINPETFQQALNTVQTTSPSYLLMASLDATRAFLDSEAGQARIDTLLDSVADLRLQFQSSVSAFSMMDLRENPWWDPTKLYIQGLYEAGNTWACRVEEAQQLAYESTSTFGSLYLAGLGLKLHDYDWLLKVFQDEESRYIEQPVYQADTPSLPLPKWVISPREAFFARGIRIPTKNAVGCIAKETVVHCPPGIPVIIPGELIQPEHLAYLPSTVQVLE